MLSQELASEDLACHATPGDRIDVEVGESCLVNLIPAYEKALSSSNTVLINLYWISLMRW